MALILSGYRAMGVFFVINSHLWTTRRMSQNEPLKRLEHVQSVIVKICNPHLALFTAERQRDLRPAVAFLQTYLKIMSVYNEDNFMKLN